MASPNPPTQNGTTPTTSNPGTATNHSNNNNNWPPSDPQYRHGLRAIQYTRGTLQILDQNKLPSAQN